MAAASPLPQPLDGGPYGAAAGSPWRAVDWQSHRRFVEVAGRRVNVVDLGDDGDRPPVVFVHGLSGCWQNWLDQLPVFARDRRVIAMDLPGFGASEMPAEPITIGGYGRAVEGTLRAMGVEGPVVVVGNSMGGFTGVELALACPERVDRLVLVSAAGLSIEYARNERVLGGLQRADELLIAYGAWVASNATTLIRRPRIRHALLAAVVTHPEQLDPAMVVEMLSGGGKPGFVPALDALTSYPIRHRLHEIACPTLVVWGDRDRIVPVRDAALFGELIADSRVVVYRDTGHVAMIERPEGFNALLAEFVGAESPAGVA